MVAICSSLPDSKTGALVVTKNDDLDRNNSTGPSKIIWTYAFMEFT